MSDPAVDLLLGGNPKKKGKDPAVDFALGGAVYDIDRQQKVDAAMAIPPRERKSIGETFLEGFQDTIAGVQQGVNTNPREYMPVDPESLTPDQRGILNELGMNPDEKSYITFPGENGPELYYRPGMEPGLTPEQQAQRKSDLEEGPLVGAGRMILPGTGAGTLPKTVGPASKVAEAFKTTGVDKTLANQSKLIQPVNERLAQVPVAGAIARSRAEKSVAQLGDAAGRAADKLTDVTQASTAGESLQSGAQTAVSKFLTEAERRYSNLNTLIPGDTAAPMQNTKQYLQEAFAQFPSSPELAKKLIPQDIADLSRILDETGQLTFSELQAFRSKIGGKLANGETIGDLGRGEMKQLYGALSRDLEAVAQARGPAAVSAARSANEFYSKNRELIDDTVKGILGADSSDKAFRSFELMTKEKGSNIGRLKQIKQRVPKAVWDDASGVVLRRMGEATAGRQNAAGDVFSPSTFLTNWNRMGKQEKQLLFGDSGVAKEIDAIATVAERLKRTEQFKNQSLSGDSFLFGGVAASAYFEPVTTSKMVALGALSEWALNSPKVLKLVRPIIESSQNGPNAMRRTISMALTMAQTDPETMKGVKAYTDKVLEDLAQYASGDGGVGQP